MSPCTFLSSTTTTLLYDRYTIHTVPQLVLLYDTDGDRWGSTRVHKLYKLYIIAVYISIRLSVPAICYLPTGTLTCGGTALYRPHYTTTEPYFYWSEVLLVRGTIGTRTCTGTVLRYYCTVLLASCYWIVGLA